MHCFHNEEKNKLFLMTNFVFVGTNQTKQTGFLIQNRKGDHDKALGQVPKGPGHTPWKAERHTCSVPGAAL